MQHDTAGLLRGQQAAQLVPVLSRGSNQVVSPSRPQLDPQVEIAAGVAPLLEQRSLLA